MNDSFDDFTDFNFDNFIREQDAKNRVKGEYSDISLFIEVYQIRMSIVLLMPGIPVCLLVQHFVTRLTWELLYTEGYV